MGGAVIFTERRMTPEDLELVSRLMPVATAALRRDAAMRGLGNRRSHAAGQDQPAPSVLILDRDDRILAGDAIARRRLSAIPDPRPVELPGLISLVAAQAPWGAEGRSQTARMLAEDGRWFLVNASLLDDRDAGNVAVVVQPAPAASVVDGVLRALGLSAREREVAALVLQGHSTKAIASTLVISPWTAQDHLKASYEKVGVSSRAELVSLVPAASAWPRGR